MCTILCLYIFETVQSQAYDGISMDSVFNPEIIYITECCTLYTLSDIMGLCEKILHNNIHVW